MKHGLSHQCRIINSGLTVQFITIVQNTDELNFVECVFSIVIYFLFFPIIQVFFSAFPSFNSFHIFFSSHLNWFAYKKKKKQKEGGENPHTLHRLLQDGQSALSVCLAPASPCQAARALRRCFDLSRASAIVRMRLSVKREEKLERSRPAVSTGPE